MASSNNLRQIALAMHNCNDRNGHCPPAVLYSKEGKPLLSWRVLLLPQLDEEGLYKQFKLDEPWDSPHNLGLLPKMPKVYAPPDVRGQSVQPYHTFYQVFVGKGTPFEIKEGPRIPADFPDGTSNTILIADGGDAVPWTKPADIAYDPDGPLPPLGGAFPEAFIFSEMKTRRPMCMVALADGSSRPIDLKIVSEHSIRAAITRNGCEKLDYSWTAY